MRVNNAAGIVAIHEDDHIALYVAHTPDANYAANPESFTKVGAWHPSNRVLLLGNSQDHPVLRQAVRGALPIDLADDGAETVIHFDGSHRRNERRKEKLSDAARKPEVPTNEKADESEKADEKEKTITPTDGTDEHNKIAVQKIQAARSHDDIDRLATDYNIKLLSTKFEDKKAELAHRLANNGDTDGEPK